MPFGVCFEECPVPKIILKMEIQTKGCSQGWSVGQASHFGVGTQTSHLLKVALHHYRKLQFGQRVILLHKVPKIVVLVDFHPILKEQWILCVMYNVVLRLKTTLYKNGQNCSCSLWFWGFGRKWSHPYLSALFGGTDHKFYIHAPVAQNFNRSCYGNFDVPATTNSWAFRWCAPCWGWKLWKGIRG